MEVAPMTVLTHPETDYLPITYAERSEFYETEHATKMDEAFLTSFLTVGVHSVLEVPCGVGRNVFLFAKHGVEVVGVDLEHQMVAQANQRRQEAQGTPHVTFAQGDMRALDLGRTFDLVVVPIDAFQLLPSDDDARLALQSLGQCVAPGGSLVIDLARFGDRSLDAHSRPIFYDPDQADGIIVHEWTRALPQQGTLTRSRKQMHDGRLMKFRFFYDVVEREDSRHLFTDLTLRMYTRTQIEALIQQAGLEIVAAFGNHNRGPLGDDSARLIYQLRPPR
mmetsp:Transcript_29296/g.56901  ORF Transcript_29296/g.56901 Transcript_29296/m.56901 type:complete len:278 (+) Transcript_29296:797-1630(+)